ncbi:hypothetical protein CP970_14805 [Streptomyces kanamyceticus]|uniref:Uncharacterized protein n=1 Tax=Streptomyces kanamyceticus TaxID=1967 RepID=A0A5J6G923_STRKN|nr:hypothetical protein CP970_14805 [Streptomyces kanamyceticus]
MEVRCGSGAPRRGAGNCATSHDAPADVDRIPRDAPQATPPDAPRAARGRRAAPPWSRPVSLGP